MHLHTADEAKAIALRGKIEHNPLLRHTGAVSEDVDAFVSYKRSRRNYSRNSGETKVLILRRFADWLPDGHALARVTPGQCTDFYRMLQKELSGSTVQSYMMTLRSFFRWAVEVKRVRLDNPVAKVELEKVDRVSREKFCEREQANDLIASASNDDLRFIL